MHFDQLGKIENESLAHVQKPEIGSSYLRIVTTENRWCIWGNNSFNIIHGFWSYREFLQLFPLHKHEVLSSDLYADF